MSADGNRLQKARLRWRCRRGLLELDWLLHGFMDHGFDHLDAAERQQFETLLDLPDPQLLAYLLGHERIANHGWDHVIEEIRRAAAAGT